MQIKTFNNTVKNLGKCMSHSLSWNEKVISITSKVNSSLHSLRFYRKSLSHNLRKHLIETLILSHSDSIVFMSMDKTRNRKLQVAQKPCVRFVKVYIPFIPSRDITTEVR